MAKTSEKAVRKDGEFLSPKSDIVFEMFFGDVRNVGHLTDFLQSVLSLPQEDYEEVTITDPHIVRAYPDDKLSILDVSVKTKSGKLIDVEIQLLPRADMVRRMLYYLAMSSGTG